MPEHVIKRGLDIPITGAAAGDVVELPRPETVAYDPREFTGLSMPKIEAKEGEAVKKGQALFSSKAHPEMKFVAPASGRVREVRRGRRRVVTAFVVELDDEDGDEVTFTSWSLADLSGISREDAVAQLLAGGMWGALKTRPLDLMANPDESPQSILVGAHETGPLQPGADMLIRDEDQDALQAGVHVVSALTDGKVFLAKGPTPNKALEKLDGVELHTFRGPHPAGDPAVQVNLVDPPRGDNQVWYLSAWDLERIGQLFLTGRFPAERIYAAVGSGVKEPRYVRTLLGAPLQHIVGEANEGEYRWIRGSVLTGDARPPGVWASFHKRAVHLIPDKADRELWGWALPSLGKWSFHRAFLLGFTGTSKRFDLTTNLWGGHRAMVPIGIYDDVVATPDILPEFLFRTIIAGDLEESIKLGLLDISREEAALCTYICPSKLNLDVVLNDGLDLYMKEM